MNPNCINIGQVVYAIFRKNKKYYLIGVVEEKSYNEHGLDGWWISILPTANPKFDRYVEYIIQNKIRIIVPLKDIIKEFN